jgi:hypothetical protein
MKNTLAFCYSMVFDQLIKNVLARPKPTQVEHITTPHSKFRCLALPRNIRQAQGSFLMKNTLAFCYSMVFDQLVKNVLARPEPTLVEPITTPHSKFRCLALPRNIRQARGSFLMKNTLAFLLLKCVGKARVEPITMPHSKFRHLILPTNIRQA